MKSFLLSIVIFFSVSSVMLAQDQNKETVPQKGKVTFIELGSVRCIPCRQMEPVLDSIRVKYPNDVQVIFYDVWTEKGKPYAKKYGIRLIPTQVFLDKEGKEYFRHTGYFPEKEVEKILKQKGVKR